VISLQKLHTIATERRYLLALHIVSHDIEQRSVLAAAFKFHIMLQLWACRLWKSCPPYTPYWHAWSVI